MNGYRSGIVSCRSPPKAEAALATWRLSARRRVTSRMTATLGGVITKGKSAAPPRRLTHPPNGTAGLLACGRSKDYAARHLTLLQLRDLHWRSFPHNGMQV